MDELRGLLDLTGLMEKSEDDILHQNVDEPITEDVNIPVPGGLSEKPKASEVPGTKISIPSGTTITADVYNKALTQLRQSFKEGVEMLELLEGVTVVEKTEDQIQDEILESAMGNALLEACENGAIFEAVDRSDKDAVKAVIKKIRAKVGKDIKGNNNHFRDINMVANVIVSAIAGGIIGAKGGVAGAVGGAAGSGLGAAWKTRLWQVIGVFHCEDANVKDMIDGLNEKYKEDLGEYKLLYCLAKGSLYDAFKLKFGWKNVKKVYFLLVDKKLPKDISDAQNEINKEIEEKNKGKDEKDSDKK